MHGLAMNGCRSLWHWPQWSTIRMDPLRTPPQGARRQAPVPERERSASSTTAYGHRSDLSPGCGQHRCWRCCRRWECSGTPWSRGSSTRLTCRSSTLLCRRRWNSWWISSRIWTLMFLCRSSKCPRSCLRTSLCARFCVLRSWQNSWWKCRRSFPMLSLRCCKRFCTAADCGAER